MNATPALSSDRTPAVRETSFKVMMTVWLARTKLHGKLIAGGALLGIVCAFLPLISLKAGDVRISAMILDCWQGMFSFLAYIACGVGAWMLYQASPHRLHRQMMIGLLVATGLTVLLGLWMLIAARSALGFGAILNILTAASVATGAFLKAKEEKMI